MATCQFMWMWRNKAIFEDDFQRPSNPILAIQNFSGEIKIANSHMLHHNANPKETIYINWKKPDGWIKLNSDGACRGGGDTSGCGGLFHNSDERWIKGYIKKIKACDALHAEMWGMYIDLDLECKEHICHLIVESDSKILIDMIMDNKFNGTLPTLVWRVRNMLALD
ncbi:ribonuclease H protein [Trifolium medium]|uniref:Ribonuclease H protein n=1 Tax=Trifolium medium TaxID=97028 RepID=A0A392NTT9_9FABA|nr:ribonuclease H protein [Trifolium medium]